MIIKLSDGNKKKRTESKESDYRAWIDSLYYPGFAEDLETMDDNMKNMLKAEYDNYLYNRGIKKESRKMKESSKYPTITVDNIVWNPEWTDIFSAYRDGRCADYDLLPSIVVVPDYIIYGATDEDEIISAISENLYERFYYYPDSFTAYDSETGEFIAEL